MFYDDSASRCTWYQFALFVEEMGSVVYLSTMLMEERFQISPGFTALLYLCRKMSSQVVQSTSSTDMIVLRALQCS